MSELWSSAIRAIAEQRKRVNREAGKAKFSDADDQWRITPFGQKGVLVEIGDKVQCHICGQAFKSVGSHARMAHGLSASEYKRIFHLHQKRGLMAAVARDRLRRKDGQRLTTISLGRSKAIQKKLMEQARAVQQQRRRSGFQATPLHRQTGAANGQANSGRKWSAESRHRLSEAKKKSYTKT